MNNLAVTDPAQNIRPVTYYDQQSTQQPARTQQTHVDANRIAQHIGYDEEILVTQTTTVRRQGVGSNAQQPEMVDVPLGIKEWIGISIAGLVAVTLLVSMLKVAFS